MVSDPVLSYRSQQVDDVGVVAESRDASIRYVVCEENLRPQSSGTWYSPCRELTARQAVHKDNAVGMVSAFRLVDYQGLLYSRSLRLVEHLDTVLIRGWRSGVKSESRQVIFTADLYFEIVTYPASSDGVTC